MHTTIDGAGRIVVPKALRDAMQLSAGQKIDIVFSDGRLIVEIPSSEFTLIDGPSGVVAHSDQPLPPLSADAVRATTEQTRR